MKVLRSNLDIHPRGPKIGEKKKAIIIGATGATGKNLLRQLLDSDQWDGVTTVTRRHVLGGEGHDKLYEVIIDSFKDLSSTKDDWNGHDVFFNCIGTTRGKAGSAKAFVDIEYGISLKTAKSLPYRGNNRGFCVILYAFILMTSCIRFEDLAF